MRMSCVCVCDVCVCRDRTQAQYQDYKAKAADAEDTSVAYLDQIEELTHKLTLAETQINDLTQSLHDADVKLKAATAANDDQSTAKVPAGAGG